MKTRRWSFRCGLFILQCIGRLPYRRSLGKGLGLLIYVILGSRRKVVHHNLVLAMPELSSLRHTAIAKANFIGFGQMVLDMLWALSATEEDIKRLVRINGTLPATCILLAPHFMGLDLALLRTSIEFKPNCVGYHYRRLKNNFWNEVIEVLRARFDAVGFDRLQKNSMLQLLRHSQKGNPITYSPDIAPNKRAKDTYFVPFMAQSQVATTASIIRLKKMAKGPLIPLIVDLDETGYTLHILPPIDDDSDTDTEAAVVYINQIIGKWATKKPENYYWFHRRFK